MKKPLIFIMLILLSLSIEAREIVLNDEQQISLVTTDMLMLKDPTQKLSIEQIIAAKKRFKTTNTENPNFGYGEETLWFRFPLTNNTLQNVWFFELSYAQNDRVNGYLVKQDQVINRYAAGKGIFHSPYRIPTFKLTLEPGDSYTLYVEVSAALERVTPMFMSPEPVYHSLSNMESMLWGGFYGALLLLTLYNLALFFTTKEESIVYYVIYIVSVLMWQWVWGGHMQMGAESGFTRWMVSHTDTVFVFVALGSSLFTLSFLDAKQTAPRTRALILKWNLVLCASLIVTALGILAPAINSSLVYSVTTLAIILFIAAGIESYRNNFTPARYFIFAWTFLLSSALIGMLGLVGILPSNFFTAYCFQMGVLIEASLFSIALTEKLKLNLENRVDEATAELRQNLEFIELQNARLDINKKEAIRANRIKSEFLANMSHEIRTPLNAIVGFTGELTKSQLSEKQKEQVNIVYSSANHLMDIVNDILDVSKIEAGKVLIENAPFNLLALVEEVCATSAPQAYSKGLKVLCQYDALHHSFVGDAFRVKQILLNLMSNAVKFTQSGHIQLKVCESNGGVQIVLADTGIGMTLEQQQKLFSAFAQADSSTSRKHGGTGLGLFICKDLTRLMNGEMKLSSQPQLGTRIELNFPFPSHGSKHPQPILEKDVLVVHENELVSDNLAGQLDYLGYTSHTEVSALPADKFTWVFASQRAIKQLPPSLREQFHKLIGLSEPGKPFPAFSRFGVLEQPFSMTKITQLLEGECDSQKSVNEPENPLKDRLIGFNILAVDDMPVNLKLISHWMELSGANLVCKSSGLQAVAACQLNKYDLILMDIQMPEMDGMEATEKIRVNGKNTDTPILAVTAHAFEEEKSQMLAIGMNDFITKPLDEKAFTYTLLKWLVDKDAHTPPPTLPLEQIEVDPASLKSMDWELALTQANNKAELAREMFEMLTHSLPEIIDGISAGIEQKDNQQILKSVHKLHGACCYTGVPKLKHLCATIESALKRNIELDVAQQCTDLLDEINVINELTPPEQ